MTEFFLYEINYTGNKTTHFPLQGCLSLIHQIKLLLDHRLSTVKNCTNMDQWNGNVANEGYNG